MRDFQERRAEIFRRSERRIAKRRRRNRVIMSCIPVVICIAVLSAVKLPFLTVHKDGVDSPSEQTAIDTVSPSGSDSDATVSSSVKVQGNGYTGFFSEVIEDPEKVENIKRVMEEICGADYSSGKYEAPAGALPQPGGNAVPEKPNENKSTPSYTVTVISPEGENVYRISGEELINEEDGSQVTLTDKQLKEITSLLFE